MESTRFYSELATLRTIEDRFEYLRLDGVVGGRTFGHERWLNQEFYTSHQWRTLRPHVIARDLGCDLGLVEHPIGEHEKVYVHHMNPMTPEDIMNGNPAILDPEFLVIVRHRTHNAIHYGDRSLLPQPEIVRRPGDHIFW
jgi:hypothetical protein